MKLRAHLLACLASVPVAALVPDEVALLVNSDEPASAQVAEGYRALRGVPGANVFSIALPAGETLSRSEYDGKLVPALRAWLDEGDRRARIRCLLVLYGMPLRVADRPPSEEQRAQAAALAARLEEGKAAFEAAQAELKQLEETAERTPEQEARRAELQPQVRQTERDRRQLEAEQRRLLGGETRAALDSELALLNWPPYELFRWTLNPLHWLVPAEARSEAPPVFLTARLDGPTPELALRLASDAVKVEQQGLRGKVYLDARGIAFDPARGDWFGYSAYDESIRDLAALLREKTDLEVVLDNQAELFQPGACPETALYCGWYRLATYVDAFDFVPGAVGYHIASSEATTLRGDSQVWCKRMIEDGIAATLGPVAEPYLHAFPKPYEFFVQLLTGKTTLVETYALTAPLESWMITLIGDPLYNPFKAHPLLTEADRRTSPPGAPPLFSAR